MKTRTMIAPTSTTRLVFAVVACFLPAASHGQPAICQLSGIMTGVKNVTFHLDPKGTDAPQTMEADRLRFPLAVTAKSPAGLYAIVVDGRTLWIESMDFRDGNCVAASEADSTAKSRSDPILGVRGARNSAQ